MITIPTTSEIFANMRADAQALMESDSPIPQLSLLNVLMVVFAGAMKLAYGHLSNVATWMLPDKAQGRFLDRLLQIYEIPVATGSAAEGAITCTGTAGTVIPAGSTLIIKSTSSYVTLVEGVIGLTGSSDLIPIQSTDTGPLGNYNGSELTFQSPITDVVSTAELTTKCTGGSDADTEVDSRNKLLARLRTPNTVGVSTDYQRIALSVDGVGRVWSQGGDEWTGPNTVAITVATSDNTPVSLTAMENVLSKVGLDSNKQPGIIVGVYNLHEEPVDLQIHLVPETEGFKANVETSLTAFFRDGIKPGGTLLISDIDNAIKMSGVPDHRIFRLTVDGVESDGYDNIEASATAFKKFSLGVITYV